MPTAAITCGPTDGSTIHSRGNGDTSGYSQLTTQGFNLLAVQQLEERPPNWMNQSPLNPLRLLSNNRGGLKKDRVVLNGGAQKGSPVFLKISGTAW